ncbi:TetR/AcrR family transcriptional regulator [Streptomyces hypolithicus]
MTARTTTGRSRPELITDAALALLVERGMRGLTHRAVDERAGLPQGSTSNYARTRQALLEATVRRLAEREAALLGLEALPGSAAGLNGIVTALAAVLHRHVSHHRDLLVARYELGLEATRRPELRAYYDAAGRSRFREPLIALMAAAGSREPERHALSLVAWCEGLLFACAVGAYHCAVPSREELHAGMTELMRGMLDGPAGPGQKGGAESITGPP